MCQQVIAGREVQHSVACAQPQQGPAAVRAAMCSPETRTSCKHNRCQGGKRVLTTINQIGPIRTAAPALAWVSCQQGQAAESSGLPGG